MAFIRNPFEPMVASLKVMPPAISGGIIVFMTILFFVGVAVPGFNDSLKLQKSTFSNLERKLVLNNCFFARYHNTNSCTIMTYASFL